MTTQPEKETLAGLIRDSLKAVKYPPYSRDIVSFGVVKQIAVADRVALVELEVNSARAETAFQIQASAEKAIRALPQLEGIALKIEVARAQETKRNPARNGEEPPLSPLQDGAQPADAVFDPDPLIEATIRPDLAPDAGYGEAGPPPLDGPMGDQTSTRWQGRMPVFQWEIDPARPETQEYGEAEVERRGWIFRMWWQIHAAGLVYASISVICEEEEERPQERRHPIGRNVAVNLVYDLQREGVVAIYGTARDFRPFVEVFIDGFFSRQAVTAQSETQHPKSEIDLSLHAPGPAGSEDAREESVLGSTGYKPVPSGDSPDGPGGAPRTYPDARFSGGPTPVPVGESPTEARESPAPPISWTRFKENKP
ncbi:MAG: DUF59 domain-containing protein [Verrucomicrobia bacterium]|nr:DUF59 domain-containing protein [Verrucomicrobiota bacterium]